MFDTLLLLFILIEIRMGLLSVGLDIHRITYGPNIY